MSLINFFQNPTKDAGRDDQAFTELYDRTFDKVYGFLLVRLSGDTHTAADLTQDTFLAVYRSMRSFSGRSAESTWVIGIAKNKLYDHYRSFFRRGNRLEPLEDAEPIDDGMENAILSAENVEFVREVLNSLPEQYRMLLTLKYMENATLRELASLTGKTVKSVDGLIRRAKAAFIRAYREGESGGHEHEK